ncbi:MAG: Jag N-terminal domain-containing protein [Endomicrobiia bacterium]
MIEQSLKYKYSAIFNEEFEGSSVEDAIKKALSELKMTKDELKIKVLFEGQKGLFGLKGSKPAKIKVYPNFDKIENVIKFYFIKLLNFVKESILLADIQMKKDSVEIIAILNEKEAFNTVNSKEIYDAIYLLTETFLKKLSLKQKLELTFKVSASLD